MRLLVFVVNRGGTLTGLVLGDLTTGLMVGATLELVSLGLVNVGAAAPPDMNLGAIIATAFTILTGATPETALTIAIPIAVLGQLLGILLRTLLASLTHRADALVEQGDFEAAKRIHVVWATSLYALSYFIPKPKAMTRTVPWKNESPIPDKGPIKLVFTLVMAFVSTLSGSS